MTYKLPEFVRIKYKRKYDLLLSLHVASFRRFSQYYTQQLPNA